MLSICGCQPRTPDGTHVASSEAAEATIAQGGVAFFVQKIFEVLLSWSDMAMSRTTALTKPSF